MPPKNVKKPAARGAAAKAPSMQRVQSMLPKGDAGAKAVESLAAVVAAAPSEALRKRLRAWMSGETPVVAPPRAARGPEVRGRVIGADDRAGRAGLAVRVLSKGLGEESVVGEGTTAADGSFAVAHGKAADRLDLAVRVLGSAGAVLAESPVLFNARAQEKVMIVVNTAEGRPPEFARVAAQVVPLLKKASPSDLTEKEIDFLAGRTGEPELHLAYFALAHRHAKATKAAPEVFYGLFRKGLPTTLPALLMRPPSALKTALAEAAKENLVPAGLEKAVDTLHGQAAERALSSGAGSPRAMLAAAGLNAAEQVSFVSAYARHEGAREDFWKSLEATPLAPKARDVRDAVRLGILTGDNAPLVGALRAKDVTSPRAVAALGREDLAAVIAGSEEILKGFPSLDGETAQAKAARVAEDIQELMDEVAPTASFGARLAKRAQTPEDRGAARILANAPDLELKTQDVDEFLTKAGESAFAGVEDRAGAVKRLKTAQRVLRVAPRAEHAEALMAEGVGSAREISGMSEAAFVERFASVMGEDTARATHEKSRQSTAVMSMAAMSAMQSMTAVTPAAVGGKKKVPKAPLKVMPTLASLFGSFGLCECKDCRSVYSPAAYLVDLLQFLNPKAGVKPLQELRKRRPDLEHILLTCENTNTVLPYVDLVNEILEFYTVHGNFTADAARNTKDAVAADLAINPEYTMQAAYMKLNGSAAAPVLPFHRPLETSRLYLDHLGVPRHEVMWAFRRGATPSPADTMLESMKVSQEEREILRGADQRPLREHYGYETDQAVVVDEQGVVTQQPWEENIGRVDQLLRRTGATFDELAQMLDTRFLNEQTPRMFLKETGDVPTGDLTKTTLMHFTPERKQRLHRFIRLARKLGWTIPETSDALRALQADDIDGQVVAKLARVKEMAGALKFPVPVILSFWGTIPSHASDSLYHQLFQNKAVLNPVDEAFTPTENGPLPGDKTLSQKSAVIMGALRVSEADLAVLRRVSGLEGEDEKVTKANLSALHRHAAMARALKTKAADYAVLLALLAADSFPAADPMPTVDWLARAKAALAAGLKPGGLSYLFLHDAENPMIPSTEGVEALLSALREGLRKIVEETTPGPDPEGERLRAELQAVLAPELLEPALGVADGLDEPADKAGFIDTHFAALMDAVEAKAVLLDPAPPDAEERKSRNRAYLLGRLLVHARTVRSRDLVIQTLSAATDMEVPSTAALIETALPSAQGPAAPAAADFLALADPAAPTAPAETSFRRLHKAAMAVKNLSLAPRELDHLARNPGLYGDFSLADFPLAPGAADPAVFRRWEGARDLFALRARWPREGADLVDVLSAADLPGALAALKTASGWNPAEVDVLAGAEGFAFSLEQLKEGASLLRMERALSVVDRVGLSSAELFQWVAQEPSFTGAAKVVNAAKAKYDPAAWAAVAKPLNDALREKSRDALVAYVLSRNALVARQVTNARRLFEFFLIDVEMGACMDTSRIKQALASVQLFVQRCLMNLEQGVKPSAIDADQWEWMKNYRVWEANRKVFLYPENWIEPELRDDKTPFFRELESQLMQNDVSSETAEAAFLTYLEKLDGVANLEVCGLYTQKDLGEAIVTHVVARTPDTPHVHYYRRKVDGTGWTPWEKIDMDIDSEHVLPRVHNNRLYLLWMTFEEKPAKEDALEGPFLQSQDHWQWVKDHKDWREAHDIWQADKDARDAWDSMLDAVVKIVDPVLDDEQLQAFIDSFSEGAPPDPGSEPEEPTEPQRGVDPVMTRWEIRLNWTENKNGKWAPKRKSQDALKSRFEYRTLGDWAEKSGKELGDMGTADTVAAVALPTPKEHYFRTSVQDGNLRVTVKRRYRHVYPVLDEPSGVIDNNEMLGHFQFFDGAKVSAVEEPGSYGYDSMNRPGSTGNDHQWFRGGIGGSLWFIREDNHEVTHVLGDSPSLTEGFVLTPEHAGSGLRMIPPYNRFFYQDKLRAYLAFYKPDRSFADMLADMLVSAPLGNFVQDEALVGGYRNRSLNVPSQRRALATGARVGGSSAYAFAASSMAFGASAGAMSMVGTGGNVASTNGSANGSASTAGSGPAAGASAGGNAGGAMVGNATAGGAWADMVEGGGMSWLMEKLNPYIKFETFFHPFAGTFLSRLYQKGVTGLLSRSTQGLNNDAGGNVFKDKYKPKPLVHWDYPKENVDFGSGAYAAYNWELFFHVPMMIAQALMKNQRFEEAVGWFHQVFNPTTASLESAPERYWNTLPFYKNTDPEKDQILNLLTALSTTDAAHAALRDEVEEQIERWREDPFNPHLIARLRITAYQKNVVMKYIDNIIQRGDQLFSQDTMESINEATLMYVLAYGLMGQRPPEVPSPVAVEPKTYAQLKGEGLDAFSNALVEFENLFPYSPPSFPAMTMYSQQMSVGKMRRPNYSIHGASRGRGSRGGSSSGGAASVASAPETLYFCVPKNDKLMKVWDTIEDRLFKIRHCLNIEGVARELPLFEPPIDPALLVRARAAGLSLASVLSDVNGPLPRHRFAVMLQKAAELCGEVKSLGSALLSALEKKDSEALSTLRAGHETAILKAVLDVKKLQMDEAEEQISALDKSKRLAETRRDYYRDIERISGYEQENMDSLDAAHVFDQVSQGVAAGASGAHIMPEFEIGTNGWAATPKVTAMFGGRNLGSAMEAISKNIGMIAAQHTHEANMASIRGGYDRRWKDWKHQEKLAEREMEQIEKQKLAAQIRLAVAEKDWENQYRLIENASSAESFLRDKYTNQELYGWMQGQISQTFFQAYKLAYDMAKRAEKAYRFELGIESSSFIQFGYWEDLRRGLLSGERLYLDLKRMEASFMDLNKREYELSKQVSLVQLDPAALIRLKETGACEVDLPEPLFDMDYPGHYMRRLKSVALTLPCVVGPYAGVNCTLTLLGAKVRRDPNAQSDYPEDLESEDARFDRRFGGAASVATSHGRNDAGMFELNFRDERYLPFEGAGAVSRWRIELSRSANAFDVDTLSDVVVHLNYTARDGGELLKRKALASVTEAYPKEGLARFFSARHEFPDAWHRFLHAPAEGGTHALALDVSAARFPFVFRGKEIALDACEVLLKLKPGVAYQNGANLKVDLARSGGAAFTDKELLPVAPVNLPVVKLFGDQAGESLGAWTLSVPSGSLAALHPALKKQVTVDGQPQWRLNPDAVEDMWFLVRYSVSE